MARKRQRKTLSQKPNFSLVSGVELCTLRYMANYLSDLDRAFTALGDPTRRAVLARLAEGTTSVSELAEPHEMALPTFLGHLRKLEDAGLIKTEKKGRVRHCTLCPGAMLPVSNWLEEQRAVWEARLDQLDDYVTKLSKERSHGRSRPKNRS